jgi:hypothetical protein
MTVEEQQLSELLKRSVPEPPVELSADRVTVRRADNSRRPWLMPVLAAASVVLVAGAGAGLKAAQHPSLAAPSAGKQATPGAPAEAPASFDPLVLPVNFGWLPAGFSRDQPSANQFPVSRGPLGVTPTQVSFGASAADGRSLRVALAARGASVNPWNRDGTGEMTVTGTAPDVNGHPAKWLAGGLEWEYANGGWAALLTGGESKQQAQAGWGRYCTSGIPKGSNGQAANPKQACAAYAPQPAQLRALLEHVASKLTWTPTRFTFPYEFTRALPKGWTVGSVTGNFVNGRLTAGDMFLDPVTAAGQLNTDNALSIQAYAASGIQTYCPSTPGAYFATYNGVQWQIQADNNGNNSWATACSGTQVNAHDGTVSVGFDASTVHGNPLGAAGVKVILPLLKLLGPKPADWTTSPLPGRLAQLPGRPGGGVFYLDAEGVELGADLVGAGPVPLRAGLGALGDEPLDVGHLLRSQVVRGAALVDLF